MDLVQLNKETKYKFLSEFFNKLDNAALQRFEDVNIGIIELNGINGDNYLKYFNIKLYNEYNSFLEKNVNPNIKLIDRSIVYESNIENDKLFIRWV
jgi:hypothetical protein